MAPTLRATSAGDAPEVIRNLAFGTALVLLRRAPPLVTDLLRWAHRKEAAALGQQRANVEKILRRR